MDPNKVMSRSDVLKLTLELKEEQELRITIDSGNLLIEVPRPLKKDILSLRKVYGINGRGQKVGFAVQGIDQRGNVALNFHPQTLLIYLLVEQLEVANPKL